ncbi:MAG TPA: SMP-30/gluconolactonase/LRE family protein [Mycobacteriales bacterium]|jgi:sugar lactone lactonase YvrE|nr:SMP-30/gluconolactonase/LRE family protein [Mycobacteriales bacterium]
MTRPSVRPVAWTPPATPERARRADAGRPLPPLRIIELNGTGPEDVVVDAEGRIVTGVDDGRLLRISPDGRYVETVADTGGRPLGIELDPAGGGLVVCDARRGLLRVEGADVQVLVDTEDMRFCNNAAVAADGTIYFSDSSRRFGLEHWRADILEHSGTGRLFRRSPDGTVDLLLDGLQFANGVALAADESFVTVAETGRYAVRRLWLTGRRAGQADDLIDNLPGFPDNIALGEDGLVWITVASPRNPVVDGLARLPALRRAVWALPDRLQPAPAHTVWVMAVDADGRVVHDLQGTSDRFHMVTGVRQHGGSVYLGSLIGRTIGVLTPE